MFQGRGLNKVSCSLSHWCKSAVFSTVLSLFAEMTWYYWTSFLQCSISIKNQIWGSEPISVNTEFTYRVTTRKHHPASTRSMALQRMDRCFGRKDSSSLTCSGRPQAPGPWKQVCLLRHPAWAVEEVEHCLESCDRAMRCTSNASHAGCDFLAENSKSHQMPHLLVELKVIQTTILNAFYHFQLAGNLRLDGKKISRRLLKCPFLCWENMTLHTMRSCLYSMRNGYLQLKRHVKPTQSTRLWFIVINRTAIAKEAKRELEYGVLPALWTFLTSDDKHMNPPRNTWFYSWPLHLTFYIHPKLQFIAAVRWPRSTGAIRKGSLNETSFEAGSMYIIK